MNVISHIPFVGLLTSSGVEGVGFFRSKYQEKDPSPDLQLLLFPFSFGMTKDKRVMHQKKMNLNKDVL